MFIAALRSLSISRPHSQQWNVLSRNSRSSLTASQLEQVFDVGSHWSTCLTALPVFCATYLSMFKKSEKPKSLIFLPHNCFMASMFSVSKYMDVIVFTQLMGKLPVIVSALIGNAPIFSGKTYSRFMTIIATFLLARKIAISLFDFPRITIEEQWRLCPCAV